MKRKPYPSDLTDAEWKLIEPLLPKPLPRGPKENVDLREVVNGHPLNRVSYLFSYF